MNAGVITENAAGVRVAERTTFEMNGGSIHGNNSVGSEINDGGGVLNLGTFTMRGGTIHSNTVGGNGGGVSVQSTRTAFGITPSVFTFDGGWIHGNTANNGSDIHIGQEGATFNNNVWDVNRGAIGSPPPR